MSNTIVPMLLYAGIDEAGYGPMLGPLCVGCVVLRVQDHDPAAGAPDLWALLGDAVCRSRRDAGRLLAIDDSKNLKGARGGRQHPLRHLERGVLGFASALPGAQGDPPADDDALLTVLEADPPAAPWYAAPTPLPVGEDAGAQRISAARLRRTLAATGVAVEAMHCALIDAAAFNERVRTTGNKATVNFAAVLHHVDRVWEQHAGSAPRIVVDRQGGRVTYRQDLQYAFPEASLQVLAESPTLSRYRLHRPDRSTPLTISFQPQAETHHLPVALASMIAKYVRELMMLRMNQFFAQRLPELKPTAGYVQDARRYLVDIAPVIAAERIDAEQLVRNC